MSSVNDFDCIREVLSGNREAYADIIRKYETRVLNFCLSLLGDPAAAEDAAQEVFVKAFESLAQFQERSLFSTWLYRIASNHCMDLLRKKFRHKKESWEALLEREGEKIHRLFSDSRGPSIPLEDADLVWRILSNLDFDYRTILALREAQGLSYQEIAEVLECSLDAVKARLRRARQELLSQLKILSEEQGRGR